MNRKKYQAPETLCLCVNTLQATLNVTTIVDPDGGKHGITDGNPEEIGAKQNNFNLWDFTDDEEETDE